jgi:hypothetical protein
MQGGLIAASLPKASNKSDKIDLFLFQDRNRSSALAKTGT